MTHGFIRLKQTKNEKARALPFNKTLWSLFSGPAHGQMCLGCSTTTRGIASMMYGMPLTGPVRVLA